MKTGNKNHGNLKIDARGSEYQLVLNGTFQPFFAENKSCSEIKLCNPNAPSGP